MKSILLVTLLFGTTSFAQVYVNGYYKSNGTYVQPHVRTTPDHTKINNYTTQGNTNPYTGKPGTVSYDE